MRARTDSESDTAATTPLWRAVQVFRLVTVLYAVGQQIDSADNYREPGLSWALIGVLMVWSVISAILLSQWGSGDAARLRTLVVVGDLTVVTVLMASTRLVADYDWYHGHQTLPTTLWAANAVMSAAILWGPIGGVLSGVLVSAVSIVVREQWELDLWSDATAPVLVSVGLAIGLAANTARRAQRQLQAAVRLTAAAEERERLAREVHDGVLQVLSYIKRRGAEIGGETEELALHAGEQEVALRVLISEQGGRAETGAEVDLRPLLTARATSAVFVSTPGEAVPVGEWTAHEIAAAVAAALSNTERHAGPGAKAYVLLEDMGDAVVVSVRDDGPGIAPGRLADAAAEGRMGVARSILGRIEALGGTAELLTTDEGTEWEFRVPRGAGIREVEL
ncbi:MacS family sensor histidine kinase [Nocardia thraciensis]